MCTRTPCLEVLKQAFRETGQDIPLKILDPKITCYDTNESLGSGSNGTNVYKGEFAGNAVAVKIIYSKIPDDTLGEIVKMKNMKPHNNVLRLLCSEYDYTQKRHMLALELCEGSLQKWMDSREKFSYPFSKKEILQQCTDGILHLHKLKYVHADLKPANILLHFDEQNRIGCVKLADFGITKYINGDRGCITMTSVIGTQRWQASEVLKFLDEMQKSNSKDRVKIDMVILSTYHS